MSLKSRVTALEGKVNQSAQPAEDPQALRASILYKLDCAIAGNPLPAQPDADGVKAGILAKLDRIAEEK
jgi:hypothetical protein